MAFRLKGFRSLWGTPSRARLGLSSSSDAAAYGDKLFDRIAAQGFNGIEASLSDLEAVGGAATVNDLLRKHQLQLIVGVYSGWTDYEERNLPEQFETVSAHLDRYRQQLTTVKASYPDAVWVNAHTGSDHWNKISNLEFLAHAMEAESRLEVENLSYETHRGRIFYSPWPTLELLEAFPNIKLTLDLSHWCVVTERLLDSEHDDRRLWTRVLPHVYHVHGRVGTAQSSQVMQLPGHPAVTTDTDRFEALWERVWIQQHSRFKHADMIKGAAGRDFSTFTPEYGPVPYTPRDADAWEQDGYDVDALCVSQMQRQRERFDAFVVERRAEQAAMDAA